MNRNEIITSNPLVPWLEARGVKITENGKRAARCPLKEHTRQDNVSLDAAKNLWHCHACGKGGTVIDWLALEKGITIADAMREFGGNGSKATPATPRREVCAYDYRDEKGAVLFQVVRFEPKDFRQWRPDGSGGWTWNLDGVRRVLFRLPEIIRAVQSCSPVFDCEGEKDVLAMVERGFAATCNPGGAGKWRDPYSETLRGAPVVVIADKDKAGREHAAQVARSLHGKAKSVRIVELPDTNGQPVKDAADFFAAGGTADDLLALAESAPEWTPPVELRARELESAPGPAWPAPLGEDALHGEVGKFVKRLEPHTESDPAAILFQTLTAFGNAIGRTAYFCVEADRHYANINLVLVGESSKSRKGTSAGHVVSLCSRVDETWKRPASGLSTGEGLIWTVRDPIEKQEPVKDGKKIIGYQTVIADHGVADKRLMVLEPEFARVLQSTRRDGNTLSAVLRQCFDTGHLRIANKNSPATATDAHVSCIGHITKQELIRTLTETEAANGFANRFLWVCVKRSKELPDGGKAHLEVWDDIEGGFKAALAFGKKCGELRRNEEAAELWRSVYHDLSAAKPGLFGAVIGRAEAYVVRLSLVYAVLDCSPCIRPVHLEAALAAWRYCEASARYIFGASLGDNVADEILAALREAGAHGLTRTEISDNVFNRHRSRTQLDRAFALLMENGFVRRMEETTSGRTGERWFAK